MDCNELQNIDTAAIPISSAVRQFFDAVSEEYVDYPKEKIREKFARRAVQNFREACIDGVTSLNKWEDTHKAKAVRKAIESTKRDNEADIRLYEAAVEMFHKRKAQFEKCNSITRSFLSPRAICIEDLWQDEDDSNYPEFSCVMFCLILFGILLTAWSVASFRIEAGHKQNFASVFKTGFEHRSVECKTFSASGLCNGSVSYGKVVSAEEHEFLRLGL